MGGNFRDFQIGGGSGSLFIDIFVYLILAAVAIFVAYKSYLYYTDSKKWAWFTQLCKEKKMSQKEVIYLRNIVIRKKISTVDDLFGSIYSLNLPSPIKRKLLWDDEPTRTPAGGASRVRR